MPLAEAIARGEAPADRAEVAGCEREGERRSVAQEAQLRRRRGRRRREIDAQLGRQAFPVAGLAVERVQAMDALRRVRPLPVVGSEISEDEEDAAGGAVALRLLDQGQRAQRLVARVVPRAGHEENEDAIERRVDAL